MFRPDPIRDSLRHAWFFGLVIGALVFTILSAPLYEHVFPSTPSEGGELNGFGQVVFGLAFLAGFYLVLRDHIWRPFVTLAREIPDPAQMWQVIGRCVLSGLAWSPVLGMGTALLCVDVEYGWKAIQFLIIIALWHVSSSRARSSVNRITQDMLPQRA